MALSKFAGLLSFFVFFIVNITPAKNYYFSSSTGNDSYNVTQAQNGSTPWKSITKLNAFFPSLSPGDSVLFKRGDIFFGNIIVSKSGTSSAHLIFGGYGSGANPVITGFTTLSAWSALGSGIYQCNCNACQINVNVVTINGSEQAMGRYPNMGYVAFQSHSANAAITSNQLPGKNWIGGELVIRKNHWVIDRNSITGQSGGTISYSAASAYPNVDGNGFFIQNSPQTLDQLGEWYFNATGKKLQMYFGTVNPSSLVVKVSAIDTLVTIMNNGYITFTNLTFQGANMYAFCLGGATNISVVDCTIDLSGINAIFGENRGTSSANFNITNSTINHTNNDAIYLPAEFTTASIQNNVIKNTGTIPGMGKSGDGAYQCINISGNGTIIQHNELDSMGYSGICFVGSNVLVKNNSVNYYCTVKDDGGGIYTYRNSPNDPTQAGSQIVSNVVLNGVGNVDGLTNTFLEAEGIYTDGYSSGVSIINNTVANCAYAGLFMNSNTNGVISGNTFFNNKMQVFINQYYPTGNPFTNLSLNNNIFFGKYAYQMAIGYNSKYGNIDPTLISNNNYFVRPLDDDVQLSADYTSGTISISNANTLPTWQTMSHQDKNSKNSPLAIVPYNLSALVGANKYAYGTFEGRTDLPYISSSGAGIQSTYDNTSKIDGVGSMKLSYSGTASTNLATVEIESIGATSSIKNYIFKFSTLGTSQPRIIGLYMQQVGVPYTRLTPTQYVVIPAVRSDNEVLFSMPTSAANAGVVLLLNSQDSTLWLDNIQFYEANVNITNPDSYILFVYNTTNMSKTIALTDTYVDVTNKAYSGSVTLAPYTSVVLMRPGPGERKIQKNPTKVDGTPVVY